MVSDLILTLIENDYKDQFTQIRILQRLPPVLKYNSDKNIINIGGNKPDKVDSNDKANDKNDKQDKQDKVEEPLDKYQKKMSSTTDKEFLAKQKTSLISNLKNKVIPVVTTSNNFFNSIEVKTKVKYSSYCLANHF